MKEKIVVTKLQAGDIIEIKKLADGTFEVIQKVVVEDNIRSKKSSVPKIKISESDVILIEAESLSLEDDFMKYQTKTTSEEQTKELIAEAIKFRVKNFYRFIMDPSFDYDGIAYVAGKNPAVCRSYNWWVEAAKKYEPSRKSRLGTRLEYGAFLGVLIKKLVEEGKPIEWAWNAVCNNSKELGHYWDSKDAKHGFEPTGSRAICGFYDLANTYKILAEDVCGFWMASGEYLSNSHEHPLATIRHHIFRDDICCDGVGWIVLSE